MADPAHRKERERYAAIILAAITPIYEAIRSDALDHVAAGRFVSLLSALWPARLTRAVREPIQDAAETFSRLTAADLDADIPGSMSFDAYLDQIAETFGTRRMGELAEALAEIDRVAEAIAAQLDAFVTEAEDDAENLAHEVANFASLDAARAVGATTKTWNTESGDPRPTHAALDGVTVPIDARFPNGLRYPGAPGPPAETVNCRCTLTFGKE